MPQEEIKHHETERKLAAIRKKCIVANPQISTRGRGCSEFGKAVIPQEDSIRLADVLLAIENEGKDGNLYCEIFNGSFLLQKKGENRLWWLRNDDLAAQSPETLTFLYDLLCLNSEGEKL